MESQPPIRRRFNSDLQNRLALIAYVPILCLGVLAAGGLIFLRGSTGVRVYGIFALVGVAVSIFVAYRTISSVLDSIGGVARSADALAAAQNALLQDDSGPIEAWQPGKAVSDDELGLLASSLNVMHGNTSEVNRKQNESIRQGISNIVVNLARRSQTLLDRQVEYIDSLESSEEDPDRLEQLFKVDHLATRMRRNAESLLVMAEADPGRRRGGPVDVADVLRVAMGEIENYQHIELSTVEPGQITAAAAMDLAHMAAELMENATQFSPPDTPVEVSGRLEGDQYLVSIVDHGMGMPEDQLRLANETLATPPELGLAMERSLGFVVIGRLAQRVGATVNLLKTAGSGVTALISVPTSVFSQVGDNSGTRRSIVAPEHRELSAPAEATGEESNSPALSKLLGLDAAELASQNQTAEVAAAEAPVAEPPVVQHQAPVEAGVEVADEPAWTPPPVTPDVLVESVAEPDGGSGWTPPPVTPDTTLEPPLVQRQGPVEPSVVRPQAPDAPVEPSVVQFQAPDAPVEPSVVRPQAPHAPVEAGAEPGWSPPPVTSDGPVEPPVVRRQAPVEPGVEAGVEPGWSPPPVTPDGPVEAVSEGEAPSKLEEALPTGEAFESGMASLLDEPESAPAPQSPNPGVASDEHPPSNDSTSSGLTRRKRGQSKVPIGEGRPVAPSGRNPEEIRSMLSRYRDGIKGNKSPATDPVEEG